MRQWSRIEMGKVDGAEGQTPVLPGTWEMTVLFLVPHDRSQEFGCDIGYAYYPEEPEEKDVLYWDSALGLQSELDGVRLDSLLQKYEVWFTAIPPFTGGRTVPVSLDITTKEESGHCTLEDPAHNCDNAAVGAFPPQEMESE